MMKGKLIVLVVGETPRVRKRKGEAVPVLPIKGAPHYFGTTVPQKFIVGQEKVSLVGREGVRIFTVYDPEALVVEERFDLPDIFAEDVFEFKEQAILQCREALQKRGGKELGEFSEEYSVYVVSKYEGDPEQFFVYKDKIASLLKSEQSRLDPAEIDYTLSFQLKYAQSDLVLVDWDGAFIFDADGEFEPALELLGLGNLQLLRYRILDKELDDRLFRVVKLLEQAPRERRSLFKTREVSQALRETILVRSRSISEFHALEREVRMIGDWYSARLYELIVKKFKLEEWRKMVKDKLDAIEDVYTIASQNLTISWERRGRIIELVGWYVLLFGWLVLLILDIYFYKK